MMLKFDFLPNLSNILVNFDNQSFDLTILKKLGQAMSLRQPQIRAFILGNCKPYVWIF